MHNQDMSIEITLNGEPRRLPSQLTAQELIAMLDLQSRRLAMEVNQEIVPRSRFAERRLEHGDRVEIVFAIGGG